MSALGGKAGIAVASPERTWQSHALRSAFGGKEDITFERFDVTKKGSMEIQLVRESWGENDKKSVDLYVGAEGSVRLSSYDCPSLKERSDEADYEYHVNVPATSAPN
jgi:hypothetical protein